MKILEHIDSYVLQLAEVNKLKESIETSKRGEFYATVEGDMAYSDKDYKLEKQYNESVKLHRKQIKESEEKLEKSSKLLDNYVKNIQSDLDNISNHDLQIAIQKLTEKIDELELYILALRDGIKIAKENGDKAYSSGNFLQEKMYNLEYRRLYEEMIALEPIVENYRDTLNILNDKSFEPNSPTSFGPIN